MNLAIISDLHIDLHPEGQRIAEYLVNAVLEKGGDALLIAGDISGAASKTSAFVEEVEARFFAKKKELPVFFCLGNHDVWNCEEPNLTVSGAFRRMRGHKGFLQNDLVSLTDKTVLVAGLGWWDFSLRDKDLFTEADLMTYSYGGKSWKSHLWADTEGEDDRALCHRWNEELRALIRSVPDKNVVLMTHMINHAAFSVPKTHPNYALFCYYNGYIGSEELNEIAREPNVSVAVSGHIHHRGAFVENGTYYTCPNLGIPREFTTRIPDALLPNEMRAVKAALPKDATEWDIRTALLEMPETPEILNFHIHDALDIVRID